MAKVIKWNDLVEAKKIPAKRRAANAAAVKGMLLEMDLGEVRKAAGVTQVELARAANLSRPSISAIEKRTDHSVSTLRNYVAALGGELEVVAVFGDYRVRLHSVG